MELWLLLIALLVCVVLAFALAYAVWRWYTADLRLLNILPEGAAIIDRNGRILRANERFCQWLARPSADVIGQRLDEVLPEAHPYVTPRPRKPTHQEFQYKGRFFDLMVVPLQGGSSPRHLLSFRDMTARKHAEAILQANERRYRALFENSNDAIYIVDVDGRILIANPQAATMLGASLEAILNANLLSFFAYASDAESFRKSITAGNNLPVYECQFRRVGGQIVIAEVNQTTVRASDGEPLHLQVIARDITARKKAQSDLQTRLEQLSLLRQIDDELNGTLDINRVSALALDMLARLTLSDAAFLALVEGERVVVTHVLGKYTAEHVGVEVPLERGITGRVLVNQEAEMVVNVLEDPDYHADIPSTRASMVLPLFSQERLIGIINLEAHKPTRYTADVFSFVQLIASRVAVAIDNARLYKYALEQLERVQQLYEEKSYLEGIKTDMIRIASHDLKNPLSVMRGYITLLIIDREQFDPIYHSFFEAMERSAERMHTLLEDILSLERIEQRAKQNTLTRFNLRDQLKDIMGECVLQANAKSQAVSLEFDDEQPLWVRADEAQIYEAITNLIGNAIKYTPKGGEICVRLKQNEAQLHFEVQDNGYGIPEDRQEKLFQPFYRARTDETAEIDGTGLGLHLVKNIIERHKGQIIFESVYGQGSTFGFTLPIDDAP
jgi:PAS domain S-box-containing protein